MNKALSSHSVRVSITVLAFSVSLALSPRESVAQPTETMAWAPATSVAVRYYVRDTFQPHAWPSPHAPSEINTAPDASHFFVVSQWGDLEADEQVFQLDVFNADAIQLALASGLQPRRHVTTLHFRSSTNLPGILMPTWSADGRTLFFLATAPNDTLQVHTLDVGSGRLHQHTREEVSILGFAQSRDTLVYATTLPLPEIALRYPVISFADAYPRWPVTPSTLEYAAELAGRRYRTTIVGLGQRPRTETGLQWAHGRPQFSLSPDGRWALGELRPEGVTAIIDLRTASRHVLQDVEWNYDEVNWTADGASLITGNPDARRSFTYYLGQWVQSTLAPQSQPTDGASAPALGFKVEVRQGANDPPRLVASLNEREVFLDVPDPALRNVWVARSKPFSWRGSDGVRHTAGLMLPRNSRSGIRLPLIIQMYHNYPQFFLPDGTNDGTSDSAQSLVARGFAVLQMEGVGQGGISGLPQEGPYVVQHLDSVVAALSDAGVIDPERVGFNGWSRSAYWAYFVMTHPGRTRFAAAVADDGDKGSYVDSLLNGNGNTRQYGGTFWQNQESWLQLETSFNVDNVRTPILFAHHMGDEPDLTDMHATISPFRINRRPFEYLLFPTGNHALIRPRERTALTTAVVDWFAFWILGEEDPEPSKLNRFANWRRTRETWLAQQAWERAGNSVGSRPGTPTHLQGRPR